MSRIYALRQGHLLIATDPDPYVVRTKARPWTKRWTGRPAFEELEQAPDGALCTVPPCPGGTWGGHCGSSLWIDDPEFAIAFEQERRYAPDGIYTSQRHHIHYGERTNPYFQDFTKAKRGFRVGCELAHRHLGPCRAGEWEWTHELTDAQLHNLAISSPRGAQLQLTLS